MSPHYDPNSYSKRLTTNEPSERPPSKLQKNLWKNGQPIILGYTESAKRLSQDIILIVRQPAVLWSFYSDLFIRQRCSPAELRIVRTSYCKSRVYDSRHLKRNSTQKPLETLHGPIHMIAYTTQSPFSHERLSELRAASCVIVVEEHIVHPRQESRRWRCERYWCQARVDVNVLTVSKGNLLVRLLKNASTSIPLWPFHIVWYCVAIGAISRLQLDKTSGQLQTCLSWCNYFFWSLSWKYI